MLQATGVAVATALAGCGGGGGTASDEEPESDADETITLEDGAHESSLEITVGQSVLWRAEGGQHLLRSQSKPEESDFSPPSTTVISGDQTFEHTFEVAGTYEWDCFHHAGSGTIEVSE